MRGRARRKARSARARADVDDASKRNGAFEHGAEIAWREANRFRQDGRGLLRRERELEEVGAAAVGIALVLRRMLARHVEQDRPRAAAAQQAVTLGYFAREFDGLAQVRRDTLEE